MKSSKTKKPATPAEAPGFNIVLTDPVSGQQFLKIRVPLVAKIPESEMLDIVTKIVANAGVMIRNQGRSAAAESILNQLGLPKTATEEEARGAILALKFSHPGDLVRREDYEALKKKLEEVEGRELAAGAGPIMH